MRSSYFFPSDYDSNSHSLSNLTSATILFKEFNNTFAFNFGNYFEFKIAEDSVSVDFIISFRLVENRDLIYFTI